jgi:hypothetical protein
MLAVNHRRNAKFSSLTQRCLWSLAKHSDSSLNLRFLICAGGNCVDELSTPMVACRSSCPLLLPACIRSQIYDSYIYSSRAQSQDWEIV